MLFSEIDFFDRFKAAADCGFNAVEIQFPYLYSAKSINQALQENELKLVMFNVHADDLLQGGEGLAAVPDKQNQFKEAVFQASEYAQILQPEAINVLPGRSLAINHEQEYLATFIDNLGFAANTFSQLGIKTVFEAINTHDLPRFLVHSGRQMLDILKQVKHSDLFMQYDLYHMLMMDEDPVTFIRNHGDKIGHIQFADIPGRGQPGTGNIDFHLLKEL